VTAVLAYEPAILGAVSGVVTNIDYPPPLTIPGSGIELSVRQRVTNLLGSPYQVRPSDLDTNTNGVDDRLETRVTITDGSVPPQALYRARYDCPSGTQVAPAQLPCTVSQASDAAGLPFPPELLQQITCSVTLSVP
jgi:hypothetical protein